MFGNKGYISGLARQKALASGDKTYVAGNPCKHCGSYVKYTTSCGCVDCNIKRNVSKLYDKGLMRTYKTKAKNNAKTYRYRSRKKNQMPSDVDHRKIESIYAKAEELTNLTGIMHHVDHIIPLSKGGLHHQDNLQVLTKEENLKKGNKIL